MNGAARAAALLIGAAALVPAAAVSGQQWSVDAQAGQTRPAIDPTATAAKSFIFGLRYTNGHSGLRLATGVPAWTGEPVWGTAAGYTRLIRRYGVLIAGTDLAGTAVLVAARSDAAAGPPLLGQAPQPSSSMSHALAGQVLPVIGFETSRIQVHGRAGVSLYAARIGELRRDRTVRLADVQLTLNPADGIVIGPVVRRFEPDGEAGSTFAGIAATLGNRHASVWGSTGQWLGVDEASASWSAGATLRFHQRVSLIGSVRRDGFDPLYDNPPQNAWSAGVSIRLGRERLVPRPPVPASYVDGRATIRLPVSTSPAQPAVAGDFNDWDPAPMHREDNHWVYTFAADPGVYGYAFVNEAGDWFVPESVPGRKDDGMGGHVAVLVVE